MKLLTKNMLLDLVYFFENILFELLDGGKLSMIEYKHIKEFSHVMNQYIEEQK